MALSGQNKYSLSAGSLITDSLRTLGVIEEGGTASATQITDALPAFEMYLKSLTKYGLNLWTVQEEHVPIIPNKVEYIAGEPNADVLSSDAFPIQDYFNRYTSITEVLYRDTDGNDQKLRGLSREEYYEITDKDAAGTPTQYYFDYKIGGLSSSRTGTNPSKLRLWPVSQPISENILFSSGNLLAPFWETRVSPLFASGTDFTWNVPTRSTAAPPTQTPNSIPYTLTDLDTAQNIGHMSKIIRADYGDKFICSAYVKLDATRTSSFMIRAWATGESKTQDTGSINPEYFDGPVPSWYGEIIVDITSYTPGAPGVISQDFLCRNKGGEVITNSAMEDAGAGWVRVWFEYEHKPPGADLEWFRYCIFPATHGLGTSFTFADTSTGALTICAPQVVKGDTITDYTASPDYGELIISGTVPIEDIVSGTNYISLPNEWLETIKYGLAVRLAPMYGYPLQDRYWLSKEYSQLLSENLAFDTEQESIYFQPSSN